MPGSSLNITLPEVGTDSWPTFANGLISALNTIINDIEPQVVTSEIDINADLDFDGNALTDLKWLGFRAGNTLTLPTPSIGFKNGDLWACDESGRQVQITGSGVVLGGSNGFRGDTAYAYYTAASGLYEFEDASGNFDGVKADAFVVANGASNSSTISFGGSVSIDFILPATAASGVSLVSIDGTGQLAHNATITTGFTVNNADITLTGTADIAHSDRTYVVPAVKAYADATVGTATVNLGSVGGSSVSQFTARFTTDRLLVGDRLKSIRVYYDKDGADLMTVTIYSASSATGLVGSSIGSNSTGASSTGSLLVNVTSPTALAAGEQINWVVDFAGNGSAGSNGVWRFDLTFDRP